MHPGYVATGRDHPSDTAANDQGTIAKVWSVTLLDRGIEGVTVQMCNAQRGELFITDQSQAGAGRAAPVRPCALRTIGTGP